MDELTLAYKLGRIEQNTETILAHQTEFLATQKNHERRLKSLESHRNILKVLGGLAIAGFTWFFRGSTK